MLGELLNETELAKKLRVSLACLRRWRLEKRGPAFVKIGPLVRYRLEDLDSWLQSLPTGGMRVERRDVTSEAITGTGGNVHRNVLKS
jgi:predicted DNA-binding transcriptional regulator AlpA